MAYESTFSAKFLFGIQVYSFFDLQYVLAVARSRFFFGDQVTCIDCHSFACFRLLEHKQAFSCSFLLGFPYLRVQCIHWLILLLPRRFPLPPALSFRLLRPASLPFLWLLSCRLWCYCGRFFGATGCRCACFRYCCCRFCTVCAFLLTSLRCSLIPCRVCYVSRC